MTICAQIATRLTPTSETPALDAQVLLAHILEKSRSWILAHPEARLQKEQEALLESTLARLEAGEPLPYVLGHWEFFGLDFLVNSDVLIPRPETELLVEQASEWLDAHPERRFAADVGTGSGCIAVSLACKIPDLVILASDISASAIQIAQANAERHGVATRIHFVHADLLDFPTFNFDYSKSNAFDLICANLPYIPSRILSDLPVVRNEPFLALDGGPDGMALIQRLLQSSPSRLAPGGLALLEIEATQGEAVVIMAKEAFPAGQIKLFTDLAGHDRLVSISLADPVGTQSISLFPS